jgi:hypothetical protein
MIIIMMRDERLNHSFIRSFASPFPFDIAWQFLLDPTLPKSCSDLTSSQSVRQYRTTDRCRSKGTKIKSYCTWYSTVQHILVPLPVLVRKLLYGLHAGQPYSIVLTGQLKLINGQPNPTFYKKLGNQIVVAECRPESDHPKRNRYRQIDRTNRGRS